MGPYMPNIHTALEQELQRQRSRLALVQTNPAWSMDMLLILEASITELEELTTGDHR